MNKAILTQEELIKLTTEIAEIRTQALKNNDFALYVNSLLRLSPFNEEIKELSKQNIFGVGFKSEKLQNAINALKDAFEEEKDTFEKISKGK